MKEFDNNKASDININVLKSISKLIVGHLVNFFNKFLDIGIFPTILKSGMITPIFKKGDSRYFDNYRPVSTLPVFGKILEKLMYNRLYSFLSSTKHHIQESIWISEKTLNKTCSKLFCGQSNY